MAKIIFYTKNLRLLQPYKDISRKAAAIYNLFAFVSLHQLKTFYCQRRNWRNSFTHVYLCVCMFCSTRWAGNSFMHLAAEIWHNSVKKCNKSTNRSLEVNWIDGILGIHLHNWHVRVCALLIAVRVPLIWMPLSHWSVVYFNLFSISAARYDCARIRIAVICRPHKFLFLYVCVCVQWHSRWRQAAWMPLQILNLSLVGKHFLPLVVYIFFLWNHIHISSCGKMFESECFSAKSGKS